MERDDLIVNDQYSIDNHHDAEHGVKIRKKIYFVTILLTIITTVEVGMGIMIKRSDSFSWEMTKWGFIVLTLVKAGYIVLSFMHLGDERRNLKYVILVPYALFILYLIFIGISEGVSVFNLRSPGDVMPEMAE
jgi:cytochrome c oxidase subunit IV